MNGLPRGRELLAVSFMLVGLMGSGLPARAGPVQPLVLEQKIPLGEASGRIDHLAVDLPRQRLFVAELGNNSLGVLDLAAGKLLRRIGGLDEPQGVAYDPASDTIFVADAGDGVVHRFTGAGLTPLDPLPLGGDADNVRLAPKDKQLVVGYGEGALALISAASGKLDAKIPLPGHPEVLSARARRDADLRERAGRATDRRGGSGHGPASGELEHSRRGGQFSDGARRGQWANAWSFTASPPYLPCSTPVRARR